MTVSLAERRPPAVADSSRRLVAEKYTEDALSFECGSDTLWGVLSTPPAGAKFSGTAVVIVVGGPQYRVGAHRQFVQLARALAGQGHAVLRFDPRGMGDSSGTACGFEHIDDDILAATDAVRAELPLLKRLVLFGLCDGAAAALLCLRNGGSGKVDGLCLLNPWVRSDATLARTHLKHYYWRRLADATFWRKVMAGGVGFGQWQGFLQSWRVSRGARKVVSSAPARATTYQQRMAFAWRDFGGDVLLLLSDADLTAKEFIEHAGTAEEWRGLLDLRSVRRVTIEGADHTLSTADAQASCENALLAWLAQPATVRVDAAK